MVPFLGNSFETLAIYEQIGSLLKKKEIWIRVFLILQEISSLLESRFFFWEIIANQQMNSFFFEIVNRLFSRTLIVSYQMNSFLLDVLLYVLEMVWMLFESRQVFDYFDRTIDRDGLSPFACITFVSIEWEMCVASNWKATRIRCVTMDWNTVLMQLTKEFIYWSDTVNDIQGLILDFHSYQMCDLIPIWSELYSCDLVEFLSGLNISICLVGEKIVLNSRLWLISRR